MYSREKEKEKGMISFFNMLLNDLKELTASSIEIRVLLWHIPVIQIDPFCPTNWASRRNLLV